MADSTATFAVKLDDETSGAAESAASALAKLKGQIDADVAALRQMQAAQRQLQQGTVVNVAAFKNLRDQITAAKTRIASAQGKYIELGGTFEKIKPPNLAPDGEGAASLKDLADGAKGAAGPLGGLFERVQLLGKALGGGGLAGVVVVASAALLAFSAAVIGAAVAGLVKLVSFGIQAAAAYRQLALSLQIAAIAGKANIATGDELAAGVASVAANVPLAAEEVAGLGAELARAGIHGKNFQKALRAMALAKIAGQDVGKLKAELKAAGGNIDAITDKIENKFGPVVADMMLDPTVQSKKLKENISALFSGLKLEPVLRGFRDFVNLFSQSTSSGRALKAIVETLFGPILEGAAKAGPAVQQFFKGMVIGALKVAIAVLLVKKRIEDAFGVKIDLGSVNWKELGETAIFVAAAIGAVVIAIALVAGIVLGSVAAVGLLAFAFGILIAKVVEAVVEIPGALASIHNFIVSRIAAMIDAGLQFASGLAQGIREGLSEVVNAAAGLAQGAVDAVKNKLKMRSPSKVLVDAGKLTSTSFAQGLDKGAPAVADSMSDAIQVPAPEGTGGSGGAGRGGASVVFGPGSVVVQIMGGEGMGEDFLERVKDGVAEALEEAAAIMGAPLKREAAA